MSRDVVAMKTLLDLFRRGGSVIGSDERFAVVICTRMVKLHSYKNYCLRACDVLCSGTTVGALHTNPPSPWYHRIRQSSYSLPWESQIFLNPLNAELNPIRHLLAFGRRSPYCPRKQDKVFFFLNLKT